MPGNWDEDEWGFRLCQVLEIRYPILEGGLAHVGNGRLAAAISEAGGFGQVGSAGRSPEQFAEEITLAASLTTKPFGVNIPISERKDNRPYFDVIDQHRRAIAAVSLSAGNPRPLIPQFKEMGLRVIVLTSTVSQALKAAEGGADVVVCEGFEAGGHNGPAEITTMALVPQVVRALRERGRDVPVAAAGGIASGEQMAAALMLGADGVQIGTLFVATEECEAHPAYKRTLVEAGDEATVVIERSQGRVTRVLRSPFTERILDLEKQRPSMEELLPFIVGRNNRIAAIEGHMDEGYVNAGQGVGLIHSVRSAGDVVRDLAAEAARVLRRGPTWAEWLEGVDGVRPV
ncbi:2-nitropropane dioxygenase [Kyrpidia spormannii]|uniref:Probable nitronate monooxygenase n=1 Tax=Kyrpidia spormannii TaxID=2055160 RepID=A0A2K8N9N6_9BACL|nr:MULTISPECIES: nitronate monooxygenase family protein [Kyrpidia]ATY86051.1 2-nitropropane dioxygenase [Kyrpidia spormannii]MCL6574970.1 nitronate monooxygenase family protein [Kyrpidia sp.]